MPHSSPEPQLVHLIVSCSDEAIPLRDHPRTTREARRAVRRAVLRTGIAERGGVEKDSVTGRRACFSSRDDMGDGEEEHPI